MKRILSFHHSLLVVYMFVFVSAGLSACGQVRSNHIHQDSTAMEIGKITNKIALKAFNAWQKGDSKQWLDLFTEDAILLDDGKRRDFFKFSTKAIGQERFTSIDKVEDDGLSIYGKFHSDTWGDFKTYFKFHLNGAGKIYKLEIGQAKY